MLSYDDRYAFDGYKIVGIKNETITSYKVGYNIAVNHTKDEHVLTVEKDGDRVIAAGVGTATVMLSDGKRTIEKTVEVKPAALNVFFILGQSNGEGNVDFGDDTVQTDYTQSIANADGTVYSTYAPSGTWTGETNTGFTFPAGLSVENAGDFVAASLTGDTNVNGEKLVYGLNGLTESGNGKQGIDSAFAYDWIKETGEKCWIINAAHSGTSITAWDPSDETKSNEFWQAVTVAHDVIETLEKEINAGHYTLQHGAYIWFQGESDNQMERDVYIEKFISMHKALKSELQIEIDGVQKPLIESCGFIIPRVCYSWPMTTYNDIAMNGPRSAQYYLASVDTPETQDIFIASNVGDSWITNDNGRELGYMQDWFEKYYPDGVLTYPTQSGEAPEIPQEVKKIHLSAHYSQVGYNEIGRDSGRNFAYAFGYSDTALAGQTPSIKLICENGYEEYRDVIAIDKTDKVGKTFQIVPVVSPACLTVQKLQITVDTQNLSYTNALLTAKGDGSITFRLNDTVEKSIQIRAVLFGDANSDGKINSKDSLRVRQYVAEINENEMDFEAADVNNNGRVTVADVKMLREYIARYPVKLGELP